MLNKEVIVIGAGLGGLFSAALLSKEGMKVTVIEKNRKPGGGMQSYNRKGAVFDTDMHVITSMFEGGSVYRLCRYLGILNDICIENVAGRDSCSLCCIISLMRSTTSVHM